MNRTHHTLRIIGVAAVVLIALTAAGCASATKAAMKQAAAGSAGAFAGGDYGQALDLYQKLYEKNRSNGKLVSRYAALIEDIKNAGEAEEAKGSYAAARNVYGILAERWDGFSALAPRLSFGREDLAAGIKDCRLALCERQFRQEIGAGNYGKALAAYQTALKDYPADPAIRSRYLKGAAEVAGLAAKAMASKDYGQAGRIDGLLLKSLDQLAGPDDKSPGMGVPSRESLSESVRQCANELTNAGLVEYRKGHIDGAIALWQELLSFDPGNAEIKKAVETAKAQLGRLKGSGKSAGRDGRGARGAKSAR